MNCVNPFGDRPGIARHVAGGRLRPLAVTSPERIVQMKDVPTFAESGYPGVVLATQVGVVVPAATPKPVIRRLGEELARVMKLPEVIAGMVRQGFQPAPLAADAFDTLIRVEMVRMQAIVKDVKRRHDHDLWLRNPGRLQQSRLLIPRAWPGQFSRQIYVVRVVAKPSHRT